MERRLRLRAIRVGSFVLAAGVAIRIRQAVAEFVEDGVGRLPVGLDVDCHRSGTPGAVVRPVTSACGLVALTVTRPVRVVMV